MNWIAHLFLSPPRIEYQLGNILADPLKGRCWQEEASDLCRGMRLHILIDRFTDSHEEVRRAKEMLGAKGALKGVAIDLLYDHFLSVHWHRFATVRRERFLHRFRMGARGVMYRYPPEARHVVRRLVETKPLERYATMQGLKEGFMRIENRLSPSLRRKDGMMGYLPLIELRKHQLQEGFLRFFPQLMEEVAHIEEQETWPHWRT